jgi:lipopolysaccharide/colanic/teichoic acid biosynthesis glycosyltransferase
MKRMLGLIIVPEMLGLWTVETGVCCGSFYLALHSAAAFAAPGEPLRAGLGGGLDMAAADALLLALTVGLVGAALGLYRPAILRHGRHVLAAVAVCAAASLPAVWLTAQALRMDLSPSWFGVRLGWLAAFMAWALLLLATRLVYLLAWRLDLMVRRIAIIGAPQTVAQLVETIGGLRPATFLVQTVAAAPPSGRLELPEKLWGVVFAGAAAPIELPHRVRRFDAATFCEDQLGRIDIEAAADAGAADLAFTAPASRLAAAVRRCLDILVALLLLLLSAPVLLIVAVLIRAESPGPVIYRQERVGLDGSRFTLFKFRSMHEDAEQAGPSWAAPADPRTTAFGALIRRLRIDELPQLVNILRGEMSMVGPRPERPHFVAQLASTIPLYQQRCRVKPGLTGWAQINYPYGASVADARAKLSYDLYYIKHRSLGFDLMILLATVRVILFQEGSR